MTIPVSPIPQALVQHPVVTTDTGLERISKRARPPSLAIVPYSPLWPTRYTQLANRIRNALGPRALSIAHVGSTSIPQMPAKAVIDIDVVVADPADEAAYVSALVGKGWEGTGTGRGCSDAEGERGAGLQFLLREPGWHQHRFFICDDGDDDDDDDGRIEAHVHVWGPGCPEVLRHQIFKDWLLTHPEDFELYASVKRECSAASQESGESMAQYNLRKEPVIQAILDRAFKARGLLD
ncbi:hypothetical protein N0V82_000663 [Gnomoniopsis sp. IMI 355080]|nr:hypothetical protein N0V82_000663 [Gnomoniopsis sp. IMI 355080]